MTTTRRRPPMHRLKPNHGTETPGAFIFLDVESQETVVRSTPRTVDLTFRLACLTYVRYERGEVSRRDTLDTSDWQEVWEWIESKQNKERPLWVMGHNLGFDLTQLHFWELLQLSRYRLQSTSTDHENRLLSGNRKYRGRLCIDGFPFLIFCLGQRGICKFVDSMNYYPYSLAQLGDRMGCPKTEWPGFTADDATMYAYCRRDVDIIEHAMLKTLDCWRESDGGVWQPTAAMLALTSFRHRLPAGRRGSPDPTIIYDDKDSWDELERDAYYGGQVTCWYIGAVLPADVDRDDIRRKPSIEELSPPTGPLYLLDVRSLYPSVMRDHKYPFRRLFQRRNPSLVDVQSWLAAYGVIARVKICSDTDEYTLRTDRGQLQAVGRYDTSLCGPELERAIDAGHVESIASCQVYCMDYLFRGWVDHWMRVRDEADRIGDTMRSEYTKLILNSLSGKFAQCGSHWVERPGITPPADFGHWTEYDANCGQMRQWRSVCGYAQERVAGDPPWYTYPAISAYVTTHGRERMRWLRGQCPARSVLYQATDAILVTSEAYYALEGLGLIRDRELGYLKCKATGEYGEVLGCNHYRIGDQWTRSGAWGHAERREDGRYYYQSFQGTASILQTQPDGRVRVCETEVLKIGEYPKGKIGPTGWVSWPRLGEDETPF